MPRLPAETKCAIEREQEIFNYLTQSNTSKKDMRRLKMLIISSNRKIAELAAIALEVVKVKPHKRKQLRILVQSRRGLLEVLKRTGLIMVHHNY